LLSTIALCAIALIGTGITQEAGHAPNRSYMSQAGAFYLNDAAFYDSSENDISTQINALTDLSTTELGYVDTVSAGTVKASKAVVVDSSKDIGDFRNLDAVNIDAGVSGTAGTVDVFPSTASKGKLAITAADSAGDTTTTLVNASQAGARTYTIPDAGASASFVMTAGAQTVGGAKTFSSTLITSSGVGAKNGATVAAVEYGDGVIHQTVLTCTATPFTFGDEAGQGQYGGTKIYDFPEGLIATIGCVIDGSMTLTAPAIDAWDGDIGLGVEAPTDHQDAANKIGQILQSTATTQAVSKVANVDAVQAATLLTESGARWRDGTATAVDLFLNLLVDDNVAHDNTITGTFTGTVTITWMNLGDK